MNHNIMIISADSELSDSFISLVLSEIFKRHNKPWDSTTISASVEREVGPSAAYGVESTWTFGK